MCMIKCDECAAEIGALKDADSLWDLDINKVELPHGDFVLCTNCLIKMGAYYTERLLPCPFCGISAEFDDFSWSTDIAIQCSNGCNNGRIWVSGPSLSEAVRKWNFREPSKQEIIYPPLQKTGIKIMDYAPLNAHDWHSGVLTLFLFNREDSVKTYFNIENPLTVEAGGLWGLAKENFPGVLTPYLDNIRVLVNLMFPQCYH